jgi:hypothetical protein
MEENRHKKGGFLLPYVFSQIAAAPSPLLIVLLMVLFCLVKGSGRYYFGHNPIAQPSRFFEFFY